MVLVRLTITSLLFQHLLSTSALSSNGNEVSRRSWLVHTGSATAVTVGGWIASTSAATTWIQPAMALGEVPDPRVDALDVSNYLRTGFVSQPMGVSGQAGKSRPETGIVLRDGSEVLRDSRTGDVSAEIIMLSSTGNDKLPVLVSYSSPWPLATGTVFDVECRDPSTGDGAFLAATTATNGKTIRELDDSFFLDSLFAPTGRFSFYGQPTDVKVKSSSIVEGGTKRVMDVTFSTLSQSTQSEIPRHASLIATIPEGSGQALMLVGSASALRWKKGGSDKTIATVLESFRAAPAPQTSLKLRPKIRRS